MGKKKRRTKGPDAALKLPQVTPHTRCRLKLLKLERIKDYLLMEEEFIRNQERLKPQEEKNEEERSKVDDLRGTPMSVGTLEEIIDDNHAIVSTSVGSEHYVSILSFVDKDQLEPGCSVLLNHKVHAVVGVLGDDTDPMVTVMKLEKAPQETYTDIGGITLYTFACISVHLLCFIYICFFLQKIILRHLCFLNNLILFKVWSNIISYIIKTNLF